MNKCEEGDIIRLTAGNEIYYYVLSVHENHSVMGASFYFVRRLDNGEKYFIPLHDYAVVVIKNVSPEIFKQ